MFVKILILTIVHRALVNMSPMKSGKGVTYIPTTVIVIFRLSYDSNMFLKGEKGSFGSLFYCGKDSFEVNICTLLVKYIIYL